MKQKTIYILEDLHTELKTYCSKNKLKLNNYVAEILRTHQKNIRLHEKNMHKM